MGAVSEELTFLKKIQELDEKLNSFESEKQTKKKIFEDINLEFTKAKEKYDEVKSKLDEFENKLKECESNNQKYTELIEKSRAKMLSVKSQKGFDALKSEIKSCQNLISENETNQLKLMDEIDEVKKSLPALEEEFNSFNEKISKINSEIEEYDSSIVDEVKKIELEKKEVFEKLKPRTKQLYLRISKSRGNKVLSRIAGTNCSYCNIDIPPQKVNEVRSESKFYMCDSCNRILYWSDEK